MVSPVYVAFPVQQHGGYTLGMESIRHMREDIVPLHQEHYAETEVLYKGTPCDPDYTRFEASEATGQFRVFTARIGGKMVGYLQYYVFRDMHSADSLIAREDAFFLTKAHRGSGIASKLLSYAEHCVSQLGCKYIGMSSKAPAGGPDIGKFLERKGYRPVALYYFKPLGVAHAEVPPNP